MKNLQSTRVPGTQISSLLAVVDLEEMNIMKFTMLVSEGNVLLKVRMLGRVLRDQVPRSSFYNWLYANKTTYR